MRRLVFVCSIISQSFIALSQSPPRIIPPSPNAASLGRYGEYPVSLNNGLTNISIPIYEIKSRKLTVPISISYHQAGVKAYDVSSSVGLGWSLNAGGAITRVINGMPDEQPYGFLNEPIPLPDDPGEHFTCFIANMVNQSRDGQADVFYYNLGGSNGKFIFKNIKASGEPFEAVTIPYSPIKINITPDFQVFSIIDVDGTTYTFSACERTKVMTDGGLQSNSNTAWYLTSIISPDKTDTVTITYTTPVDIISVQASTSLSVRESPQYTLLSGVSRSQSSCVSTHSAMNVQDIIYNNGKVSFEYSSDRIDVKNAKRLTAINVFQKKDEVYDRIRKFNFTQTYFISSTGKSQIDYLVANTNIGADELNKRLRLDAVQELGFQNALSIDKPPYTFEYETAPDNAFPVYGSTAQDFMGFFNGKISNKNLLFYDYGVNLEGPAISREFGANREVDPAYIKAGTLKKINYPTGGYTLFETEPNEIKYTQTVVDPIIFGASYTLTSRNLSQNEVTFTITLPSGADASTLTGSFACSLVNDITGEPLISTTVNLFDLTTNSMANIVPAVGPPSSAMYGIPSSNSGMNVINAVILNAGHSYKLSYGTSVPVTNNFLYTTVKWSVNAGTITYAKDIHEYTGGLRIKTITSYDGISKYLKKKFSYTKSYYNSGLFNGDTKSMADIFRVRTSRFYYGPANILDKYFFNNYGENVTFQIGSSSNTVASYEEVEEYSVDRNDNPLGKTVSTFNKAIDNIPSLAPYFRSDEGWKRSQLRKLDIYKSNGQGDFVLLSEQMNDYDYNLISAVKSYSARLIYDVGGVGGLTSVFLECPSTFKNNVYSWIDFDQYVYKSNLTRTTSIQYYENPRDSISTETQYFYDNPDHQLLTRTTQQTSDDRILIDNVKYPLDFAIGSCDIKTCYSSYANALSNLLAQKKTCEAINYSQYAANSDVSAFNQYLECKTTFQNQIYQTVLPALNSCKTAYGSCIDNMIAASDNKNKSLLIMQRDNVVNKQIEKTSSFLLNGVEKVSSSTKTDFKPSSSGVVEDVIWGFTPNSPVTKLMFDQNPLGYYEKKINFSSYDYLNNIIQYSKINDVSQSYIWDYNKELPIAEVKNASISDIAYTSFEADGLGNWLVSSMTRSADARTGIKCYDLGNGAISKSSLGLNKTYVVNFWAKTQGSVSVNGTVLVASNVKQVNGWRYYECIITGTASVSSITISGTGLIDELRLFPKGAQMTTYTYSHSIGLTAVTDPNSVTAYYEYDPLGRLLLIRDKDLNITKKYSYQYKLD
jgi:YD repeat-containing protein